MDSVGTNVEIRRNGQSVQVGVCNANPRHEGENIFVDRAIISRSTGFLLRDDGIEEWLKKQTFIVTEWKMEEDSSSSRSFVCKYSGCGRLVALDDDLVVMDKVVFNLGGSNGK